MRLALKFAIVLVLTLAILVPLAMIRGTISERQAFRQQAVDEVARSHAGAQQLAGPVLVVPYTETVEVEERDANGVLHKQLRQQDGRWTFFPKRTQLLGRVSPSIRKLGLHEVRVYELQATLEAAFDEDAHDWGNELSEKLARHPLTVAGLDGHQGVVRLSLSLGVPIIGLGASAPSYYPPLGPRLGTRMILPEHAGVANAIGAVVGQVSMAATGLVTAPGPGLFVAHLPDGPKRFNDRDRALAALESSLSGEAEARARAAGVEEMRLTVIRDLTEIAVEGKPMFIEAQVKVVAQGRPRIATG